MSSNYNCSVLPDPIDVQPYGDISGIGVLLGFLLMAWITIFVLIFYYIFAYDPSLSPFRDKHSPSTYFEPNPIDVSLLKLTTRLRSICGTKNYDGSNLEEALNQCVLTLADAQLLTSFAILISGYYSLGRGISAYHWQTIVYLAWFSSLTHLSALTFLRRYFYINPAKRAWRVFLMTTVLVLLIVAFVPTGYFNLSNPPQSYLHPFDLGDIQVSIGHNEQGELVTTSNITDVLQFPFDPFPQLRKVLASSPAICFFKLDMDLSRNGEAYLSLIFSLSLLLHGCIIRLSKLYKKPSNLLSHWLRGGLDHSHHYLLKIWEEKLQKMDPDKALKLAAVCLPLQATLYHTIRALMDVYTSMASEIYSLLVSAIWGLQRIREKRAFSSEDDNDWSFGQIIPLVLLASPVISIFEIFYKHGVLYKVSGQQLHVSRPSDTRRSSESDSLPNARAVQSTDAGTTLQRRASTYHRDETTVSIRRTAVLTTLDNTEFDDFADAERSNQKTLIESEVHGIIQESRDVHAKYQSNSTLLLLSGPVLLITVWIATEGFAYVVTTRVIFNLPYVMINMFLFQPACIQTYTMSLIYLERAALRTWPRRLAHFVLFSSIGSFSLTSLIFPWGTMANLGFSIAALFGAHLVMSLLWASLKVRHLRSRH